MPQEKTGNTQKQDSKVIERIQSELSAHTQQTLAIREPRPYEAFYLTGNMAIESCLVTSRAIHNCPIGLDYFPGRGDGLEAIKPFAINTTFLEAISREGERFAYPCHSVNERGDIKTWATGDPSAPLMFPFYQWVGYEYHYGNDCENTLLVFRETSNVAPYDKSAFLKDLEATLSPNIIDRADHPLLVEVEFLYCNGDEVFVPDYWYELERWHL